jgi:hypothetical protein
MIMSLRFSVAAALARAREAIVIFQLRAPVFGRHLCRLHLIEIRNAQLLALLDLL